MVKKAAQAIPNRLLQGARKARGWTQSEVAERIGAPSPLNVTRWERGTTTPSAFYLEKLCHLFETSPKELGLMQDADERLNGMTPAQAIQRVRLPEVTTSLWNVPHRRNPFFTGREDLLRELHYGLAGKRDIPGPPAQALCGLGGIGKTQLALEYTYRFRETYRAIFWVRAASYDTLATDFMTLARLMQLPEYDAQDQQVMIMAVKRWLSRHQDWLLILDNADELALLPDFLPTGGAGHLLLTTRAHAVGPLAPSLPVEKLGEEESMLLLLRRARVLAPDDGLASATPTERALAQAIVRELDSLPLALDQAGAYLEETGCSLSDYLQMYHQRRHALLTRRSTLASDYPYTVANTWALSFEQVAQSNPAAAELLRLCAFLDADAIPEAMLKESGTVLGSVLAAAADPLQWHEAMRVLRLFSLIRRDAETKVLSLHRLVQVVLRAQMDEPMQRQWAERAVRVVNAALPEVSFAAWSRLQECLPHVQVCASLIARYQLRLPEAGRLLNHAGWYLRERGLYQQAEPLLKQALALREELCGPAHPDTAATFFLLAYLYHQQGNFEQGEALCHRTLAALESVFSPEHPALADRLFYLAWFYLGLAPAQFQQVESLFRRTQAIYEQVLGPDLSNAAGSLTGLPLADALYHLGVIYAFQGQYEQAMPLHRQALIIRERELGSADPRLAHTFNELGFFYLSVYRYAEAESFFQQVLAMTEQGLEPHHPEVAASLHCLAFLYHQMGQYEQAERLFIRALTIQEEALGAEHPLRAETLYRLGRLYEDQGQHERALPFYEQALAIRETVLGPEHTETLLVRTQMSELRARQNMDEDAASPPSEQQTATAQAPDRQPAVPSPDELTAREKEVLHLIAQGLTNVQIAEQLTITRYTVHSHVRSIYGKLGISTRSAATRYAVQHKLL